MSIQVILRVAVVLLAIAASDGLVMAGVRVFADRNPPAWLPMLHGLPAAAGLTLLLLFAAVTVGISTYAVWALGLLVLAALGGLFLNLVIRNVVSCCSNGCCSLSNVFQISAHITKEKERWIAKIYTGSSRLSSTSS